MKPKPFELKSVVPSAFAVLAAVLLPAAPVLTLCCSLSRRAAVSRPVAAVPCGAAALSACAADARAVPAGALLTPAVHAAAIFAVFAAAAISTAAKPNPAKLKLKSVFLCSC